MKKLVLFAVAAVALSFVSCSGKGSSEATPATDSIPAPVVVEEVQAVIADSVAGDTAVVEEVAVGTVK